MSRKALFALVLISASVFAVHWATRPKLPRPAPTEQVSGESEDFALRRSDWIEQLHRHAPGLDWRAQDARTLARLGAQRAARLSGQGNAMHEKALGSAPPGTWVERGANNLAGRVSDVDYDAATDRLTVFADGGQLWRSTLSALDWQPLNDARHFQSQVFVRLSGSPERWLVADDTRQGFYYSDDQGATWTQATGFVPDNWYGTDYLVARDVAGTQVYALVEDYNADARHFQGHLLASDDRGASFSDTGFVDTNKAAELFAPGQGSKLEYLLDGATLKRIEPDNTFTTLATIADTPTQTSSMYGYNGLAGGIANGTPFLYAFFFEDDFKTQVFRSLDGGSSWAARSTIDDIVYIRMTVVTDLHDPAFVYFGSVNLSRSADGGATFTSNNWGDYYSNPAHALHADINFVRSFATADGGQMLLIGTDGGLYQSTDHGETVTNLSLTGMRQAQYYDSYTQRMPPYAIAAGSQDQGYQRNSSPGSGILAFDQVASGDYAHLTSSDGGATIWSNYPGFTMLDPGSLNPDPTKLPAWSFTAEGRDMYGMLFLPPLLADPVNPRMAWLGGGSATNGLNHVIQLSWDGTFGYPSGITGIEGSFDFGGKVTALASGGGAYYAMALAGGDASFFRSATPFTQWTAGATSLPRGHHFNGNDIEVDAQNGKIYVCGSGYSGPPVYVSTDDGNTFAPMSTGLPNTLVYNLALSPDGAKLFAATEVGPFYYDQANSTWVDIGAGAPDNVYWGVDYIPALNVARFATYGRGLWDYQISANASDSMPVYQAASGKKPCDNTQVNCLRVSGPKLPEKVRNR